MKENLRKKELLSGGLFAAFIAVAGGTGLLCLPPAVSGLETPAADDLLRGKWPPQFERGFREALPVNTPSRDFWGRAEYTLFHQGRRGVVVGSDGWLFTEEEFSCPVQYAQNMAENLSYISDTQKTLAKKNTRLAVVLIPAKSRVLQEHLDSFHLPSCRQRLYAEVHDTLVKQGIAVTDLLTAMQQSPLHESLYFKTDTHWSPTGAQLAAQSAAQLIHMTFKDIELPGDRYSSKAGAIKYHEGDLAAYLPGVPLPQEPLASYVSGIPVASMETGQNLLGDAAPPVTLVGTSYSANHDWNFEGFLKEALGSDVLNAADQGQGPFAVMDKYLQDNSWQDSPPRLVVWEMPERYFLMPHGVAGK
jgi:alginate O-acetyltransferase complex protein AlgJ